MNGKLSSLLILHLFSTGDIHIRDEHLPGATDKRTLKRSPEAQTVWFLVGNGSMGYWDYQRGP